MKNVGIYVSYNGSKERELLALLHNYLSQDSNNSVFMFTDSAMMSPLPEIASVNSYLMDWSKCDVVFTNAEDFEKHKHKAVNSLFACDKKTLSTLSKELVNQAEVLIVDLPKNKIRKAKNAELQKSKR